VGKHGTALRDTIASGSTTPLIGVYDMLSATVAAEHYDALFVSGFAFAASYYGLPDVGFAAWPDIVNFVHRLRLTFPTRHLLVDIDDGYGDTVMACHVVAQLERSGASGVILEDQRRPRHHGPAAGAHPLPLEDYLDKLDLVLRTRDDLAVVARTGATDEPEALRRAQAMARTDADAVLVDGVHDAHGIRRVRDVIGDKPLLFNQIVDGRSPRYSLPELHDMGVDAAVYGTHCLFAAQGAIDQALTRLRHEEGVLPEVTADGVGVAATMALLEGNLRGRPKVRTPR